MKEHKKCNSNKMQLFTYATKHVVLTYLCKLAHSMIPQLTD